MTEFVVELLVIVAADSFTDAEVLGERARAELLRQPLSKPGEKAKIVNVIVADVRDDRDEDETTS